MLTLSCAQFCIFSTVTSHNVSVDPKSLPRPRGAIGRASKDLGVTREHLSRVLHGHRISRSLTSRYAAWLHSSAEAQELVFVALGGSDLVETGADGVKRYPSGKTVDEVEQAMKG